MIQYEMNYFTGGAIRPIPFMDSFNLTLAVALRVYDFPLDEIVELGTVGFGLIHLLSSTLCCVAHDASGGKDKL